MEYRVWLGWYPPWSNRTKVEGDWSSNKPTAHLQIWSEVKASRSNRPTPSTWLCRSRRTGIWGSQFLSLEATRLKEKSYSPTSYLGCRALARIYDPCWKALDFVNFKEYDKTFWLGSRTILSWLKTPPRDFRPFVSVRVSGIQETVALVSKAARIRIATVWWPNTKIPTGLQRRLTRDKDHQEI